MLHEIQHCDLQCALHRFAVDSPKTVVAELALNKEVSLLGGRLQRQLLSLLGFVLGWRLVECLPTTQL